MCSTDKGHVIILFVDVLLLGGKRWECFDFKQIWDFSYMEAYCILAGKIVMFVMVIVHFGIILRIVFLFLSNKLLSSCNSRKYIVEVLLKAIQYYDKQ